MPERLVKTKTKRSKSYNESRLRLLGFLLLPMIIFPLLSITSYDWRDIRVLHAPPNDPPANLIGLAGAWGTYFSYLLFGFGTWLLPLWLLIFSLLMALGRIQRLVVRLGWCTVAHVMSCALLQLTGRLEATDRILEHLNIAPNAGGFVGWLVMSQLLVRLVSPVGGSIIAATLLLGALLLAVGPAALAAGARTLMERFRNWRLQRANEAQRLEAEQKRLARQLETERKRAEREAAREQRERERERKRAAKEAKHLERERAEEERQAAYEARKEQMRLEREQEARRAEEQRRQAAATPTADEPAVPQAAAEDGPEAAPAAPYQLPTVDLLDPLPNGKAVHGDVEMKSQLLVRTLSEFGITVEVTHVEKGPVVTSFELLPAPGIRVERIANMAKNLEMALKATSVRVEAPIPGKGVVGVETPNDKARPVTVRELLEGPRWTECVAKMAIPLLLGKNVGGRDMIVDLATVPHMLIAGATGSGKSVCINAILTGLLMSRTPSDLRLMLIDPKIVEFAVYNELPHLVAPVITDPKKVALGLRWAINEMEKRYKLLHAAGVRNIADFNRRPASVQPDLFAGESDPEKAADQLPPKLPYIVIIIDELADLMLQAGPEIENCIARLAQLSRAVGIHLILATQRPSVNVITGTIKANFPGRIAFQVAQRVDSRTILDGMGAETLIGRGDMLFLDPRSSKMVRAQGAYIGDHDARKVIDFIRSQCRPVYMREVEERLAATEESSGEQKNGGGGPAASGDSGDELFDQAVNIVRETKRASTSSLQRRLRIGYTRAARLMDMMEERGIVGPPRGSDPREILIDLDGEIPHNDTDTEDTTQQQASDPDSDAEQDL